jgi:hypothetical protein
MSCTTSPAEASFRDWIDALPFVGSKVARTIDLYEHRKTGKLDYQANLADVNADYAKKRAKLVKKKANAPTFGWPLITDSREDYQELIDKLKKRTEAKRVKLRAEHQAANDKNANKLKDRLKDASNEKLKKKLDSMPPASHQAYPVYDAILNLRKLVNKYNERLVADKTNYKLATSTYQAEIFFFKLTAGIAQQLITDVDQKYKPDFVKKLAKVRTAIADTKANRDLPKDWKVNQVKQLEYERRQIKAALPMLDKYKKWSRAKTAYMNKSLSILKTLERNASLT